MNQVSSSSSRPSSLMLSLLLILTATYGVAAYSPPRPRAALPLQSDQRPISTNEYVVRRDTDSLPAHFRPRAHDHDHGSHSLGRRSTGPQGSTEASAANSALTPDENCTPYYLSEINAIASQFPAIWEPASIVTGDQEATDAFARVNASGLVPSDIPVRGTQPASLSGTGLTDGYDSASDPDCWWTASHCTSPSSSINLAADVIACPEPGTYGYSFDDGPNCTHNALYDAWQQANQKASLMYIGSNVMDWPLEAQRGIVDGHHICVHTWSHRYLTAMTDEQVFAEFWYTLKAIKTVMGITPTCWRPPYGDVDNRVRGIAQALGLTNVMWNQDTNDWNLEPWGTIQPAAMSSTYASIAAEATQSMGLHGGTIVLEHELEDAAMNFSISELATIKAAWPHVMPVGVCMNWTRPYVEQSYVYPDFEQYIGGQVLASGLPGGDMAFASPTVLTSTSSVASSTATTSAATSTHGLSSGGVAIASTSSSSNTAAASSAKTTSSKSGALTAAPSVALATLSLLVSACWIANRM